MVAITSSTSPVLTRPTRCSQHARFYSPRRLSIVAKAQCEGRDTSLAAKVVAVGAALLMSAAPAFAVDDSGYVEQKRKDSAIRQNQDSGKASPPPAPNADNTISGGAPKLQSPVRDIVGKVTGGAGGSPGAGTPAAPNTTR